jgi:hypothetical protein
VHGDEATYYIGAIEIETNQGDVTETGVDPLSRTLLGFGF